MRNLGQFMLVFLLGTIPSFAQQPHIAPQANTPVPSYAVMPSSALTYGDLTPNYKWQWTHDAGTPGSSTASSAYPVQNPSFDNIAREFYMSYSQRGGERFSLTFAQDTVSTHFIYDAWVLIDNPSQLANLELDINQVISTGQTVILSFQCSSYSGTWEYGLISNKAPHWHASNVACDPRTWSANLWHHVQIASHRDSSGNVSYDWVNFDGTYKQLSNATGYGALALHWAIGAMNINFQLDGASQYSGSVKVYHDKLTVWHW